MIQIELRSNQPIYEQIVSQVKELIVKGLLKEGDAMPSIRKLATQTRTNPNTVARAYQELERLGLIETLIGRGAFVKAKPEENAQSLKKAREALKPPLLEMMLLGLTESEIMIEAQAAIESLRGEAK